MNVQSNFKQPARGKCDLIMKGGITSGVVYPKAITAIAKEYRLTGIGGSSAGAIAAILAAAAEYRRQSAKDADAFQQIENIPGEIGEDLGKFFQPSKPIAPIFRIFTAVIKAGNDEQKKIANEQRSAKIGHPSAASVGKDGANRILWARKIAGARAFIYEFWAVFATSLALACLALASWGVSTISYDEPSGFFQIIDALTKLSAFLVILIGLPLGWGAWRCFRMIFRHVPEHNFGLCTGTQQEGHSHPGLTDWMHAKVQQIAGKGADEPPLLIRDLERHGINLVSMTTDLSTGRPYQLPLKTRVHYFSEKEFCRYFEKDFVQALKGDQSPRSFRNEYGHDDLYQLPTGPDFPVLLIARMSLSFPGLISALPLYKFDRTFAQVDASREEQEFVIEIPAEVLQSDRDKAKGVLKRCLFSDGGISSNFPVHFFDAPLPGHPTFGISLAEFDERRHGTGPGSRINLPENRLTDSSLPVRNINGVLGFLFAIVNTAKDWQDTLQRLLPGFSERIVEIRLAPNEGGMNLAMDEDQVAQIVEYGGLAGDTLVEQFCFDEHRWKRVLVALPEIEQSLESIAERYDQSGIALPPSSTLTYTDIINTYKPKSYGSISNDWRSTTLQDFADKLVRVGRAASAEKPDPESARKATEVRVQNQTRLPFINAGFRLVASPDREPKNYESGVNSSGGTS